MAKGGFMCIGYVDSMKMDIDDIVSFAHGYGAETAYIFHDLDACEPHFHFIFMWAKSPLGWDNALCDNCKDRLCIGCKAFNFKRFMIHCGLKAPKKGTSIVYDYNTAVIKDIDSALEYMVHEHEI